ncbi:MAG: type IV pilus assembly protein PilM [Candidatus Omnitrophica bacterium]|nr:type IV pilus assembly protein PilM [Candidatus Omnitrophota bacterium]
MINLEGIRSRFLKPRFSVGLDIGTSSAKLIKLRFLKETVELVACEVAGYRKPLAEVVKDLAEKYKFDRVNISVSGSAVVTRYVVFPKMQPEELNQSLKFEVQKHIPFDINEVYLDAHILRTDLADNKMLVLVCAVKKDFINSRLKLFESPGLRVNLIDVDSLSMINAFLFNYSEDKASAKTLALLNVGNKTTNLSIVDELLPGLNRDIHLGGDNFTEKLQELLHLDFAQAEAEKLKYDPAQASGLLAATESVVSSLSREIRTSFDYYESQNASTVGKIFLSGAGTKLPGFKDTLANMLGIEVDFWDPLRKIIFGAELDAQNLKSIASQLAVAVGLALR